jgi:hypothetical protein
MHEFLSFRLDADNACLGAAESTQTMGCLSFGTTPQTLLSVSQGALPGC